MGKKKTVLVGPGEEMICYPTSFYVGQRSTDGSLASLAFYDFVFLPIAGLGLIVNMMLGVLVRTIPASPSMREDAKASCLGNLGIFRHCSL